MDITKRYNAENTKETTNHTKGKEKKRAEVSELRFPYSILFYCVAGKKTD